MANHKSAEKRVRQTAKRKEHNHYYAKTARNAIKALRATTDKKEAEEKLPKMASMLDKLVNKGIIHRNKAINLKSGLAKHVAKLESAPAK